MHVCLNTGAASFKILCGFNFGHFENRSVP